MNNSNGFYLTKLVVSGLNVPDAIVTFNTGPNLITGASNTGKSYILSCIIFLLGGADVPKGIKESKAYNEGYLEIRTYDNLSYTIFRDIKDGGKIYMSETEQKYFKTSPQYELSEKHGKNGLSNFLLDLSGFDDKKVRINDQNKKKELSFRDITKYLIIDEQKVIAEHSPVYKSPDAFTSLSSDEFVFSLLLTGQDAKDLEEIEEEKVRTSRLKGQLELLTELQEEGNSTLTTLVKNQPSHNLNEVDTIITNLQEELTKNSQEMEEIENSRKKTWEILQELKSKLIFNNELISRFNLLQEHYVSDLERLEFVTEGNEIFNLLISKKCPICDTLMDQEHLECARENNIDVRESIDAETNKIKLKLADLTTTKAETQIEINLLTRTINSNQKELDSIDLKLNNFYESKSIDITKKINALLLQKNILSQIDNIKSQVTKYYALSIKVSEDLKKKPKKADIEKPSYSQFKDFCNDVEDILTKWKYPELTTVEFDSSYRVYDIEISGIQRKANGKGVRAITYTAFLFGLLSYCLRKNMPHPKFIIIDSPLTTYHGGALPEDGDEVQTDMQTSFFDYLSKITNDRQIILMDNKIPSDEVKAKINYIHFGGPNSSGRKGFFPT